MTANLLEHRRAKAFAEALEARGGGGAGDIAHGTAGRAGRPPGAPAVRGTHDATGDAGDALTVLLGTVDALTRLPAPALDAGARAAQRAQLIAAFEAAYPDGAGTAVPTQRRASHRATALTARLRPRTRWGRRFAAGGLVASLTVGGLGGVSVASSNSLPGDTLYGMKRSLETWRLDWAGSDTERGALLLDQSATRLREAQRLVSLSGGTAPGTRLSPGTVARIGKALDDMHAEGARGRNLLRAVYRQNGSLTPMRKLASYAASQEQRWSSLEPRLPAQLTPIAEEVRRLLDDINHDIAPLHLAVPGPRRGPAPAATAAPGAGESAGPRRRTPGSGSAPATAGPGDGSPSPGASPAPGVVGGLTDGVLGGSPSDGTSTSGSGSGSGSDGGTSSPSPSSSDGQGITIPPLVPGLPTIGIGL